MTYNIFSIALYNYDNLKKDKIQLNNDDIKLNDTKIKNKSEIDYLNFDINLNNYITDENFKNMDIIGLYDKRNNIWIWGYIFFNTKMKKIFDIIYDNTEKNEINNIIRYTFLNSKFILSDKLQLDIILSLSTYYLKTNKLVIIDINKYYTYYASIIE